MARSKDYKKLRIAEEIRKAPKESSIRITQDTRTVSAIPSERHPEILSALITAVQGYWRNDKFVKEEDYASVSVSDSINNSAEFESFMNYLSTPEDGTGNIPSAESLGAWSIKESVSTQINSADVTSTSPAPATPAPSTPTPNTIPFGRIRNRRDREEPTPRPSTTPPTPPTPPITNSGPTISTISEGIDVSGITNSFNTNTAFNPFGIGNLPSGGSGSGRKIICNELYRQGFLSEDLWNADERYGDMMFESDPKLVIGYQMWARSVVKFMRENPQNTKLAYKLFKPWTEYMGYKMGVVEKPTLMGRLTNWIGTQFSYMVFDLYGGKELLNKYNNTRVGYEYKG